MCKHLAAALFSVALISCDSDTVTVADATAYDLLLVDAAPQRINSASWIVSSTINSDNAYLAIDGRDDTRWTTGMGQRSGQDFFIDMRTRNRFDRIVLDSSGNSGDYPRSYVVSVSDNNSIWTDVAAGTGTSSGRTLIDFADQNEQYVRISQRGSAYQNWWSIHELQVFRDSSDETTFELPVELPEQPQASEHPHPTAEPDNPPGTHEDIVKVISVAGRNPGGVGWHDSYSVGDKCYMSTNFDHGIGDVTVDTPLGQMKIKDVFDRMTTGPGRNGRPIYNDIQCGNGPTNTASDETDCPGRVDIGREGCGHIGPKWDLSNF